MPAQRCQRQSRQPQLAGNAQESPTHTTRAGTRQAYQTRQTSNNSVPQITRHQGSNSASTTAQDNLELITLPTDSELDGSAPQMTHESPTLTTATPPTHPSFRFHDVVWLDHRKNLDGHPSQNCAADSWHFSKSMALAYTFLVFEPILVKEKEDGRLKFCRMQCALCNAKGSQKGWFEWNKLSDQEMGCFHKHFKSMMLPGHLEWWKKVDMEDKMLQGINGNVEEHGTIMSLVSCISDLVMLTLNCNHCRIGRLAGLQVSTGS